LTATTAISVSLALFASLLPFLMARRGRPT
jgi:hypothetical protein